jgi:hypothetical protein
VKPGSARLREFVLPARHTPAETGLFLGRRPEVSVMQIAQQATELAIADLITPHEQRFEQLGEESEDASGRARSVMASVWASVSESDMGRSVGARGRGA